MPAGDAQRTWFPEMIEILRARWNVGLACAELIELRDELDTMLHQIRAERHIRPPVIECPRCGRFGKAAAPDDTVRAMILSVGRFGHGAGRRSEEARKELGRKTERARPLWQGGGASRGRSPCVRSFEPVRLRSQ